MEFDQLLLPEVRREEAELRAVAEISFEEAADLFSVLRRAQQGATDTVSGLPGLADATKLCAIFLQHARQQQLQVGSDRLVFHSKLCLHIPQLRSHIFTPRIVVTSTGCTNFIACGAAEKARNEYDETEELRSCRVWIVR